jgi:hypothetical protein
LLVNTPLIVAQQHFGIGLMLLGKTKLEEQGNCEPYDY